MSGERERDAQRRGYNQRDRRGDGPWRGGGRPGRGPGGGDRAGAPPPPDAGPRVDREATCPFLIRAFPRAGAAHRLEAFDARRGRAPTGEVAVHTWADATLAEVAALVLAADELHEEARRAAARPGARLALAFVYPDRSGRNVMRAAGAVPAAAAARAAPGPHRHRHGKRGGGGAGGATLRTLRFEPGDLLSVAIL
jgi:hypothetical protein